METNDDLEIHARLKALQKNLNLNEEHMREAAVKYQDLLAEKESLLGAIGELKKERAERDRRRKSESDPYSQRDSNCTKV